MICPKCESPTEVINSRKKDGTVVRRRLCACGERFSTKEVVVDSKQVNFKKVVKALSMTKAVTGEWTIKVDEDTPKWAKKMLLNL
jgi:transcriptional regulator NrdR family protein